ncbi:MAG: DUF5110 domain-containing protein [Paludibacter sp.]|jgi:alpha-D-xyloside xylohydrolase|nr:DUF5110 domain-containing protein [Paludibacter sp.]
MLKPHYAILFLLPLFLIASTTRRYEKLSDGVIVYLPHETALACQQIRLQVISDNIIHVTATPNSRFTEKESLIIVDNKTQTEGWNIVEKSGKIVLKTAALRVSVSLATGEIVFADKNGNIVLAENNGGGKSFENIEVEGKQSYTVHQVFESPDNEAFFGLGQHQSDEFNYKGKNEILYQYNTKVSVPFVVSSKNYGLLWDNYSLTKFGDPRNYSNLDQFKLYDKNGNRGGITAIYENNAGAKTISVERLESGIDYENLETVKNFPPDFPFSNSNVSWEGYIEPSQSGLYRFILYYAGYTKVFVDNQCLVAERWRTAWNPNSYKFSVNLQAGQKHKIRIEWRPDGGVSYIGLKALSPRKDLEQNKLSFWSEMGDAIDYYFVNGQTADDVIKAYRHLTGKAPIMPKWAMGFWQSRERYKTEDELLSVLGEYRKRNIPIDNIVQDWSYWKQNAWGSHDFDAERFPNPAKMVDSVHSLDAHIMISVWPKFYHTTVNYQSFDTNGWMYNRAVSDSIRDWIGKGFIGGFYDAYSEGARKLFWEQINEKLYSKGFDAWWMDASEPDILSNASMTYRKALSTPTALGSSTEYFNTYALQNAKGIYEGQRQSDPNKRVFLLTRSGFAGLQRYSTAVWSGDIGTRWEDMKAQISAGLNFSISGIPYWTMDIGGFCVERRYERAKENTEDMAEWRELNTRWFQFGAFCPLFRSHGQYPYREIFNIAPENHPAYQSMVYYDRLRYRLMPYIYSLAAMTYFDDYSIMRPLVMDFGNDAKTHNIGDQYMFGTSIMVNPVYEYKAKWRKVYLPKNTGWYDFESEKYYSGGQYIEADAPYERIPLFVREGSLLPLGNIVQSTNENQNDLTILVFEGKDGEFKLYDDNGNDYNYEKGEYSIINLKYNDKEKILTISPRKGQYHGMPLVRRFEIKLITKTGKQNIIQNIEYSGEACELKITNNVPF